MSYYVYFITFKQKGNTPVKIGYSKNPAMRCKDLQTACPYKLFVPVQLPFEAEELAREAERTFQWLAKKKHKSLQGEWFLIYGKWSDFIGQVLNLFDHNQQQKQR